MSGKKGVIDLIVGKLHMDGDDDDAAYYGEDDEYYDGAGSNIEPFRKTSSARDEMDYPEPEPRPKKSAPRLAPPARSTKKSQSTSGFASNKVSVVKPTVFEEARNVTDMLLQDHVVVLNLEGLDVELAQRIIDFASGSTYAMDGNLQKISRYIFVITPASVDISGDFPELLTGISTGVSQRME